MRGAMTRFATVSSWIDEMRTGAQALTPANLPYPKLALALILGVVGGWAFQWLRLPLPWMLGPMTVCMLAALVQAPIAAPQVIRQPMSTVIGVMLGSAFGPSVFAHASAWLGTLAGLVLFMTACGATSIWYLQRFGGVDAKTAYFAGMPGGAAEMIVIGEERGADVRAIALIHGARIFMVVMSLPFIIQWLADISLARGRGGALSMFDAPALNEMLLIGCAVAGALLGHMLRLPAKNLLGPMLVSAAVHLAGLSDFKPPFEVVNAAQLIIGVTVGGRFAGIEPRMILALMQLSLGTTVIMLAWTGLFAFAISRLTGFDATTVLLAYSPGGLAEMSLVAIALNAEVALVAAHHIVRIVLVMVMAAPIFALLRRFGFADDDAVVKSPPEVT